MSGAEDVWDDSVAPGGYVCGACGMPTESEPCTEHQSADRAGRSVVSVERPFRHLCQEADVRDAMSDQEFWAHVYRQQPQWDCDDEGPDLDAELAVGICGECGSQGACAYDSEGLPLIHADGGESS